MDLVSISLLFSFAAIFAFVAQKLRQPLLVGYLFAGFLLAQLGVFGDIEMFSGLGQVGVAFLLFLVGLEIKLDDLSSVGRVSVITGIGQIIFTGVIGTIVSRLFGIELVASLYIAGALAFSSTIIIVKLLSQKRALSSLYGKISLGFLLIQDVVAVLVLSVLAGLGSTGKVDPVGISLVVVKSFLVLIFIVYIAREVIPKLFKKYFSDNSEISFIVTIAWALGFPALMSKVGLTYEIGGFLAGLALSNVSSHLQIASRTRPIRDFFLTIFFILLGANLSVEFSPKIILPALIYSLVVLFGNPIIVFVLLRLQGFTKRISFFSGLAVAQISEFSFILVATGLALGHLTEQHVSMIILVGVITMTTSTYLILGSEKIYPKIKNYLKLLDFVKSEGRDEAKELEIKDHIVVVGADKSGMALVKYLIKSKINFIVVDFNPKVHERLRDKKIKSIFADIADEDTLEAINISKAKLIVSTPPNLYVNMYILEYLTDHKIEIPSIVISSTHHEAKLLYDAGANYVVIPDESAGEHLKHILKLYKTSGVKLKNLGETHNRKLSK